MKIVTSAAIALTLVACGRDDESAPTDALIVDAPSPDADTDAASPDALVIDAPTDARVCIPVTPAQPPRVPRALATRSRDVLTVYAQRSNGFRSIWSVTGVGHTSVVAWGDFDGEGIDELATGAQGTSSDWGVRIFGDSGSGLAQMQQQYPYVPYSLTWLRTDGDPFEDLGVGTVSYDKVYCGGASSLTECWSNPMAENQGEAISAGDFDGDGDDDLAIASYRTTRAYRDDGASYSMVLHDLIPADGVSDVNDVDWVELDGCEGMELVAVIGSPIVGPLTWKTWRWNGASLEEASLVEPIADTTELWWADFDGDGDDDPLVCKLSGGLELYRRDGTTFQLVTTYASARDCDAAWGDMDADGDPDLAYTELGTADAYTVVLRNDNGTLNEMTRFVSNISMGLAWGRCGPLATSPCFPSNSP